MAGTVVRYETGDEPLSVLFSMATEQEYGPALRAAIAPQITGVGPVEAAAATSHALAHHMHEGRPVDLIISLGSAGSRLLTQGAIYQVSSVSYRDMDASPLGVPKGQTPFLDMPAVIPISQRFKGIPEAAISTGGAIVNGADYDAIEAEMVDMETYAVVRAAHRFGTTVMGLRGISDGKEPLTGYQDWRRYLMDIDERLAAIVTALPDTFGAKPRAYWKANLS